MAIDIGDPLINMYIASITGAHPDAQTLVRECFKYYSGTRVLSALQRMGELDITGWKLARLWIDCCNRSIVRAMQIIEFMPENEIFKHLDLSNDHGIPFNSAYFKYAEVAEC